ncbi:GNAT family N-acetyltransferase [Sulfobacillus thermosulfidooxidans]|uniref:GNAT family N-acetyltransferase n=1 Tax=Sulfobacillus thermosulfidooxidans TaxID=28034 RepID=UPI00030E0D0B|nr:GNAT family protein [Sulfobacillus thermosulfidooxidans]
MRGRFEATGNDLKDNDLRLVRWDESRGVQFAEPWYQDPDVLYFSEGPGCQPFNTDRLWKMYRYLHHHGQLYIIETFHHNDWRPIGDVTLAPDMMPIVIGDKNFRGQGLGFRVISLLIRYAQEHLKWSSLVAHKIYVYNAASLRVFTKAGFCITHHAKDDRGLEYVRMERQLQAEQDR